MECPDGDVASGEDETVSMRGVPGLRGCNGLGCEDAGPKKASAGGRIDHSTGIPSLDLGRASAAEKEWLDVGVGLPWGREAERGGTTTGKAGRCKSGKEVSLSEGVLGRRSRANDARNGCLIALDLRWKLAVLT